MAAISQYLKQHEFKWDRTAGVYTDAAPAMLGFRPDLTALVKTKNPSAIPTQCVIHCQFHKI